MCPFCTGSRETSGSVLESTRTFRDNRHVSEAGRSAPTAPENDRFQRSLLVLSIVLITVGAFEALALTTVMPQVARELNGDHLYALALGVPLATHVISTTFAGRWVDARGAYLPVIVGCALAGSGLLIAGLAPAMELVAIGRAVMGLGTGLLMVALYAMVGSNVPTSKQPTFFAAFAAAWIVPSMFGPYIAGVLAEWYSWRVVFLIVVPILAASVVAMIPILRPLPRRHEKLFARKRDYRILVFAIGAGGGVALMQMVTATWRVTALIYFIALAIAVIICLHYLLPTGTLRALRDSVGAAVATRMWINAGVVATEAFLPLMLVQIHGWTEKTAGIVLAVGGVSWGIGSFIQSRIHDSLWRHRLPLIGGLLSMVGVAIAAVASLPAVPPALTALAWALAGTGIGLTLPAMSVVALAVSPKREHGTVSAALQIVDGIGAAFAIAVVGVFQMLPHLSFWPSNKEVNPFFSGLLFMAVLCGISLLTARRVPKVTAEGSDAIPSL